ncbi:hypothetical protein TNCV_2202881 [Trichonephila clavipes]|uniref:Uncharacterized protein n=1 Tax=Trichonephila clavipes TaxID=2585209 RepID=A0A8X6S6S0_TRICX|nr:hypothetical protein TNCV_2202861 [Trichonephila clavipes]GFY06753.1 hypothetical protein TNCV_2202881 [Trichonephila clavipes]
MKIEVLAPLQMGDEKGFYDPSKLNLRVGDCRGKTYPGQGMREGVRRIEGLSINSWEGISELGHRRHTETHQQCVLFTLDPVMTARLKTNNVYPDIGAHGARAGMCRDRWDRLRDNSSKEPSPMGAEKGQNIRG